MAHSTPLWFRDYAGCQLRSASCHTRPRRLPALEHIRAGVKPRRRARRLRAGQPAAARRHHRPRPRASLGPALLPDGRMLVTERAGRLRSIDEAPPGLRAAHRRPARLCARPGRSARHRPRPAVRPEPPCLSLLFRARRARYGRHRSRARQPHRDPPPGREGDLSPASVRRGGGALRLASRLPPRRHDVHHPGRPVRLRRRPQDLTSGLGKVVRINPDGRVPRDNPFVGRAGARPEIGRTAIATCSARRCIPHTGQLWTVEHGARGGDELNRPEAGKNYGWPMISYGSDYSGARSAKAPRRRAWSSRSTTGIPSSRPPACRSTPAKRSPAGRAASSSARCGRASCPPHPRNGRVTNEERYLGDQRERIRDVRQGPDGLLYLITDSGDGRVLRVTPAAPR